MLKLSDTSPDQTNPGASPVLGNRRDLRRAAEPWTFISDSVLCSPRAAPVLMCVQPVEAQSLEHGSCRSRARQASGPRTRTQVGREECDNMQNANRSPFLLGLRNLNEGWEACAIESRYAMLASLIPNRRFWRCKNHQFQSTLERFRGKEAR